MGCQMNKSDTERMLGILEHFGYTATEDEKSADLLIINTCSIRQLSEDKAFSKIGLWGKRKRKGADIKIGFCGCVAKQKGAEIFKRAPYVDFVMAPDEIAQLPEILGCGSAPDTAPKRSKSVNAWIPIMNGCNNFCTYCIVPYTRGRERSREPEVILKEAREAIAQGFKEITLLGQNVDSFIGGENYKLPRLLRDLNAIEGKFRIRFVTSYPTDITDELIAAAAELDKVCEYFHIPMQSGSTEILKAMNRRYTREEYVQICAKVRTAIPDVTITSDFIAGFPGETEEQFLETLSVMDELELDYCNTAAYSPREKTVAAAWTDKFLSKEVKNERLARLNEHTRKNCLKSNKKFVGRTLEILAEGFEEGVLTGRTRNNKIVHIPCERDLTGEFLDVKITGATTWYLRGALQA